MDNYKDASFVCSTFPSQSEEVLMAAPSCATFTVVLYIVVLYRFCAILLCYSLDSASASRCVVGFWRDVLSACDRYPILHHISSVFAMILCVLGVLIEYIFIYCCISIFLNDSQHSFRILATKMDGMKMGRRKGKGIKVLCVRRSSSRFSICLSACYRGLA